MGECITHMVATNAGRKPGLFVGRNPGEGSAGAAYMMANLCGISHPLTKKCDGRTNRGFR